MLRFVSSYGHGCRPSHYLNFCWYLSMLKGRYLTDIWVVGWVPRNQQRRRHHVDLLKTPWPSSTVSRLIVSVRTVENQSTVSRGPGGTPPSVPTATLGIWPPSLRRFATISQSSMVAAVSSVERRQADSIWTMLTCL